MSTLDWLRHLAPHAASAPVDHPMASLEEAKKLLAELPAKPERCLAEAANWLASIAVTPGFAPPLRAQIVTLLEERAAPSAAAVESAAFAPGGGATKGFAASDAPQPEADVDPAMLEPLLEYASALAEAQQSCLASFPARAGETELPAVRAMLVRHASALARRMALRRLLRRAAGEQDWSQLDACYARAAAIKSLRTAQPVDAPPRPATVLREYLRAVLFELAAPESLNPRAIELLYRVAGRAAASAQLVVERSPAARFAVFPGAGTPPRPVGRASAGAASARYLDLTQCVAELRALLDASLKVSAETADDVFGAEFKVGERNRVLAHAVAHWGADAPHRPSTRIALEGGASIARGLAAALERIDPYPQGAWLGDLARLGPSAEEGGGAKAAAEAAVAAEIPVRLRDASAHGLGLVAPRKPCRALRVGSLVAVHADTAAGWAIALVRRIGAEGEDLQLGLEVVAPHPRLLWLRLPGEDEERLWARSKGPADVAAGMVRAALLAADPRGFGAGQLLIDPGFAGASEFDVPLPDRMQRVRIARRLGGSAEFQRVAFAPAEVLPLPRWATSSRPARP
jgi:hypothetical protein